MTGAAHPKEPPLPAFRFRTGHATLWEMATIGVSDPAATIPDTILDEWSYQLRGPNAPLVVSAPDLAREVLNDRADHFTRDRLIRRAFRRSWGKGLAAAEGEDWQRQRRAAVPFFRPSAVAAYLAAFASASDAVLDRIDDGAEIELTDLCGRIIARIVLSVLVAAGDAADPDAAASDVPAYIDRIAGFGLADLLPLSEAMIDRLRGVDSAPAVVRLRALAARIAAGRMQGAKSDMIALIEGIGPVEDNIRGLFPAAMDTTVTGTSWALYTLGLRPEWQERLALEARAAGAELQLDRLADTRRAVSEVLRLYPPGPFLIRCAAQDMELDGQPVRAGQSVMIAIYAMHRHHRLWDQPDAFDPDRFLPGRNPPDALMPFGTGPRMCIAAHFAQAEMATIIARVLTRFRIEPVGPAPAVSLQIATRAVGGLPVRLARR